MSKPQIMPAPLTQHAFSFVSDDEAQEMAKVYEDQQRRRIARIFRNTQLSPIAIEVLKEPIFTPKGERFLKNLDAQESQQAVLQFVFNKEPSAGDKADDIEAILGNIPQFAAHFMDALLEGLADVGGVDEKLDTLEWIFAGDTVAVDSQHVAVVGQISGSTKVIPMRKIPFSFTWTCSVLGLSPERMRDGIEESLIDLQRTVDNRIAGGELKPMRRIAVSCAVEFIKERSTNECYK